MIEKDDIESKDFSMILPRRIAKIQFVAITLEGMALDQEGHFQNLIDGFYEGMSLVLGDVADDLETIHRALYRSD